ncbi:MAG TPA: restriction endonuclease, partial [Candidatus Saccharimonadales bacterium]
MKKGRYYEEKTAGVVQKFNPQAQVLQGIHVTGKLSKVSREIDVQLIDPAKYDHIVFECKDHKAKVDIELVEALVTKLKDLDTKKGAIVSNSGFTKGAYNIAAAHGIDLLSIVDTGDDKIRTQVFAPHIIEDTYVSAGSLRLDNMQSMFRLDPNLNATPIKTDYGMTTWADILAEY